MRPRSSSLPAWLACHALSALLTAIVAGPTVAAPAGVRLIQAEGVSVLFSVEVPAPRLQAVPAAPDLTELLLDGYELDAEPGEPALASRVVLVAVPPTGEVRLSHTASPPEWRDGVKLVRVPWLDRAADVRGADLERTLAMMRGPEPGNGPARAAAPVVRLLDVSWMRDQRVARVVVAPAAYDPGRGRLGIHRRIEIELAFDAQPQVAPASRPRTSGFEEVFRGALVNYQQGLAWRRAAGGGRSAAAMSARTASVVPDTSVFAGRPWVKIAIPRTGFYKVEFGQVRNSRLFAGSDTTRLDSLRLFVWPGVPVLPEDSYCDSCAYREVAIGFVDAGLPGRFDDNNNDAFYFYALGASDWTDLYVGPEDAPQPDTVFLNHPYEALNYYYLTIATNDAPVPGAPKRIDNTQTGALVDTVGAATPSTFTARMHAEQDLEHWPDATPIVGQNPDRSYRRIPEFWEKWFWSSLSNTSARLFRETVSLPGLEPSLPTRVRLRLWGLSLLSSGVKSAGIFDHHVDVRFGDVVFPPEYGQWDLLAPQTFDTTVTGLSAGTLTVEASVIANPDPPNVSRRQDRVGVAWFDVFYPRRFEPIGNELAFDSDPAGGKVVYDLGPFSVGPDSIRLFDVTDPYAPLELQVPLAQFTQGPGGWRFRFNRVEPGRRRYRVLPDYPGGSRIVNPPNNDVVDAPGSNFANLRRDHTAEYLVIFADPLGAAAESLTTWRAERLPLPGATAPYDTMRVPISAIYDQFSGGRTDPGAIRNFLRAALFNWSVPPTFVTVLGDASYDFKNVTGSSFEGAASTLVPSYEGGFDFIVSRQFATDDWLLNVDHPTRVVPDFLGGRIPAADAAAALSYVRDKLLLYERTAPRGEWRDRVMLVADDNEQGKNPDPLYWAHMEQTVDLDTDTMPPEVDRAYVYLHTYPDDVTTGETKPEARDDIMNHLADGVVMFNYIGHGSPFKLSDESVFSTNDVELVANRERPTVLVAASCAVGKFNNPATKSLGEQMLFSSNAGAVAVVSATEEAISINNASLNRDLYLRIFSRDTLTGQFEATLAAGLLVAKTGYTNSQKYQVMGDAAVRPILPRLWVEASLVDLAGSPVTGAQRGQTVVVRGQVFDRPGGTPLALDGIARLLIEDSAPVDTVPNCFGACFGYPFTAAPMFRGDVSVTGGQFETRFVVPMNADLGPRGRARAYVEVGGGVAATDGVGRAAFPLVAGTAPTEDRTGPRVTLAFVGGSLKVRPDALLRIDLFDESGILITGNAPQNGIIVTVDESSAQRHDVTESFRYAANSHQAGAAFFQLPGLAAGPHRIRVSAADNLASGISAAEHRSSAVIDFEVTESPALEVRRAILFPNPVRSGGAGSGGQFVIDAPGDSVRVLLKIYTVAGRVIRVLRSEEGLAQVQIPWDGLDAEGDPLARGVYLFKVQVFPRFEGGAGDGRRAETEGRFVVVGR